MLVNGEEVETAIELVEVEAADRLPWIGYSWCQTSRIVDCCNGIISCTVKSNTLSRGSSTPTKQATYAAGYPHIFIWAWLCRW